MFASPSVGMVLTFTGHVGSVNGLDGFKLTPPPGEKETDNERRIS